MRVRVGVRVRVRRAERVCEWLPLECRGEDCARCEHLVTVRVRVIVRVRVRIRVRVRVRVRVKVRVRARARLGAVASTTTKNTPPRKRRANSACLIHRSIDRWLGITRYTIPRC